MEIATVDLISSSGQHSHLGCFTIVSMVASNVGMEVESLSWSQMTEQVYRQPIRQKPHYFWVSLEPVHLVLAVLAIL